MNKAAVQYIQLVCLYRLILIRYYFLFNLVSLLNENEEEPDPSLEKTGEGETPLKGNGAISAGAYRCVYFYHGDHLGSSNYITDEKGQVFEHAIYLPYGETWIDESHDASLLGYKFTGKELDEETNLYYFGARYYDPKVSSWISTDPALGNVISDNNSFKKLTRKLSLYSYGQNNPIVMLDPNGLDDIYYDQKGNEVNRDNQTKWYDPKTWGDRSFVQGNKAGQWWQTDEKITPGSINGVVDSGVAEGIEKFKNDKGGEANTARPGNMLNALSEVMDKSPQGKAWDYKRTLRKENGENKLYVLDGKAHRDDYIGNVAWGAIMKYKGFSQQTATEGAGAYQTYQDIFRSGHYGDAFMRNVFGNGDDPRDKAAIIHGYKRF
ncbi:MAG: polymorphic toxin type 44 domain-containing protein [Spirochaetia bacterium]|nr:polymorphic toxin type 44 domain-containing protein [Spirochaetia bacterium]